MAGSGQLISNFTNSQQWDGNSYMETNGGFVNLIETYNLNPISQNIDLTRTFYLPPQEQFYIVKYSFKKSIKF